MRTNGEIFVYDAIVVGARCAGAPLAMLLARQGARVLLVDRATFPSDIPHGYFIHRHGPKRLHDWGVLPRIAARTPGRVSLHATCAGGAGIARGFAGQAE
jgi:2-polyprenyl-6-methoxyphenol hydroxylase-like FAD-dependent oxidoreductase